MKDVKVEYINYLDSAEGVVKYNEFKKILYGKKDTLVLALFKIIYPKIKGKKEIDILDVGGGDGRRLRHLMDLFKNKGIDSKAELVEPSKVFTQTCRAETDREKYRISVKRSIFEKYETKRKFDLIFLIHSIYTFKNDAYLRKIKKHLKPGGVAVFIVNDKNSFLGGLKKIMDQRYQSSRNNIDTLLRGLSGVKYEIKKFDTNFSGILTRGKLNRKGNLILEWISLDELSNISEKVREQVRKYFVSKSQSGRFMDKEVVVTTSFEKKE